MSSIFNILWIDNANDLLYSEKMNNDLTTAIDTKSILYGVTLSKPSTIYDVNSFYPILIPHQLVKDGLTLKCYLFVFDQGYNEDAKEWIQTPTEYH